MSQHPTLDSRASRRRQLETTAAELVHAAIETALQQETGSPLAGSGTVGHQREKGQAAHV